MRFYDATLPVHEGMILFPGDPPFRQQPYFQRARGDPFNLTLLSLATHGGTHVDPPAHYIEGGPTVDQLPMESLIGPGIVVDLRGVTQIGPEVLSGAGLKDHKRILMKTDNGPLLLEPQFHEDYVHLTQEGAAYLVEMGVRMVGIDYLSIERFNSPGAPVHHMLLKAGVVVVEGAHLLDVPAGVYEIICLPLRLKGADGSPVRLVLRQ